MDNVLKTSHHAVPNNLVDVDVTVHEDAYSTKPSTTASFSTPSARPLLRRRSRSSDYPLEPSLVILRRIITGAGHQPEDSESQAGGQNQGNKLAKMKDDKDEETWEVGGAYVFPETSSLFQLAWLAFGEMKSSDRSDLGSKCRYNSKSS